MSTYTYFPIPLTYEGDGTFRVPSSLWAQRCDKFYVVHETYRMSEDNERSKQSHDHQFAWLEGAWNNLPERYKGEPWALSPITFRKHALIRTGFCHIQRWACGSRAEAKRWAERLSCTSEEDYCEATVDGPNVVLLKPESQKKRKMGAKRFQESKTAVLEFASDLLGVPAETLSREAGRAA